MIQYSISGRWFVPLVIMLAGMVPLSWSADPEVLRPRVPVDQIEAARAVINPLAATPEVIAKGKNLFEGKAFCRACHGAEGKGLGMDLDYSTFKGPLPRNFTDKMWQQVRAVELFWILKNGSPGTACLLFVPLVLTEKEAWQVLMYVRSFVDDTLNKGRHSHDLRFRKIQI